MNEISAFIQAVFKRYDDSTIEKDQKLPSRKTIEKICHVLLNVSTMKEEGRYPSFRVCFISPDSELLEAYLYAHARLFEKPLPFTEKELHRLAPALNPAISYLMVDISQKEYRMIGILSAFTMWEKIITREVRIGNRLPRIPNFFVKGPGEMEACIGETSVVSYRSGATVLFRTDTFTSTLAAERLRNGSGISEAERLRTIYRILWRIRQYQNGALLFIVPSAEACDKYLNIKYKLPIRFSFRDENKITESTKTRMEKDGVTFAELIAKFTAVDGGVVLTKDLDLLGFGAETLVDNVSRRCPRLRFVEYDNTVNRTKSFYDNGMRHRACYYLCDNVQDSVSVIISQDGIVKVCTKVGDEVVVYDNVALPLI